MRSSQGSDGDASVSQYLVVLRRGMQEWMISSGPWVGSGLFGLALGW
jgi:hypothetical protein